MKVPLKQPNPQAAEPEGQSPCSPVQIAKEAVALQERKMQIMGHVFDKINAYEETAEKRVKDWLQEAKQWQQRQ